ncbi:chitin synthase-domain-containing protein [Fomitopsis serialis]|uniref:chitin synthase-domain-containing protein n=1 Tax=Fomitopsis serialis TaxID=139415 RepID=UPI0020085369|nr:chitin synthase-domain-containing protein [Neoantrodia serialis]KAH9920748.1 chitin synthase-domain-containing protein [Neoantrodia serialis]
MPDLHNMANKGSAAGVYDGITYGLINYIASPTVNRSAQQRGAPYNSGQDATRRISSLGLDSQVLTRQKTRLRNLFAIGRVEARNSLKCQFALFILLAFAIGFIASINFGSERAPEDHDKFVICQYDDKRKLLLIVCDGQVAGSDNDQPTPRIVLGVLGAPPNIDAELLSFLCLGEGAKHHNMGKAYSDAARPVRRRGLVTVVHFNAPTNPLEFEMYHQIKNVIGINPSFYESVFMTNADTAVYLSDRHELFVDLSIVWAHDKKSIATIMTEVYEYFIWHHMAKAFEPLFGSVSRLPGCFRHHRPRTPDAHKPLFISNQIIDNCPQSRHAAHEEPAAPRRRSIPHDAVAPDDWKILLSQRWLWINSAAHNLGELVLLEQMCGFCCFSMRFIVMMDLVSALIQPVAVACASGHLAFMGI